jgi:hypothetical protein
VDRVRLHGEAHGAAAVVAQLQMEVAARARITDANFRTGRACAGQAVQVAGEAAAIAVRAQYS